MWRAKGDDIRARRANIQKAAKEIINGIKSKLAGETNKEEPEVKENSQHSHATIRIYRADGIIHATVNGEEKKFWVDKVYYPKLKASADVYKTLMELVRQGYAGNI